ncbi:hypothetical protein JHK87_050093 [Glycine soja]|nr:hypothetical protein JHK87_050093 [Glycine soja]
MVQVNDVGSPNTKADCGSGIGRVTKNLLIRYFNENDHIQRTVIVSIHQPSSEVFQLFNNLCRLSLGKTVYFGPAFAATEFLASNGFPCPPLINPSDHLLKTINNDFDQFSSSKPTDYLTTYSRHATGRRVHLNLAAQFAQLQSNTLHFMLLQAIIHYAYVAANDILGSCLRCLVLGATKSEARRDAH